MLGLIGIIILGVAVLVLSQPLIVLLHEIGHAIPAVLLTRSEKVEVYAGSYGDKKDQLSLKIGRCHFYMTYNPLEWTHGLCKFDRAARDYWKNYLVILGGPLVSIVTMIAGVLLLGRLEMNGFSICIIMLWLITGMNSIYGFVLSKRTVSLKNGDVIYSDLAMLKRLWKNRKNKDRYFLLGEYEGEGPGYQNALLERLEYLIEKGKASEKDMHRVMCMQYNNRNYKRATELADALENTGLLGINDRYLLAYAFRHTGNTEKAIAQYSAMIEAGVRDPAVFNDRGYIYLGRNHFDQALIDFNAAIAAGRNNAFPYNNRGLVKILLGRSEEGLEDISTSIMLNDKNAYAYRNLGIYYLEAGDHDSAIENFEKAYRLDKSTPMLDTLLNGARAKKQLSLKG